MSTRQPLNSGDLENTCVVCFKNVDIYSVGVCDHPVCFECSTRMRVLCNQIECPICRQEMPKVLFTRDILQYSILKPKLERLGLQDPKYGLLFGSSSIQRRYYRLLDHECFICKRNVGTSPFRTFQQLKDHMRRIHELFYCDLCTINLKIFTFERKCYTRVELATHRRKGDADNTSHRGHPLCEFCETRFMDNDELFRHLRRDHLFCHFCDADGKHQYYSSYGDLRKHYVEEHYLCEEGDCKHERFTSVFRTDIDLKAHYAAVHSRNLSKAANRQARTLELEFTLAPRPRAEGTGRGAHNFSRKPLDREIEDDGAVGYDNYFVEPGGFNGGSIEANPLAAENFPTLGGDSNNTGTRTVSNVTITSKVNPLSEENFPSLRGNSSGPARSSAVTITTTKFNPRNSDDFPSLGSGSVRQPAVTITRTVRGPQPRNVGGPSTNGNVRLSVNSSNVQDRPTSSRTANVSIHLNHNGTVSVRPKTSEAFPALSSEPIPQPKWVPQKPKKQEPKVAKVAPAPALPPSNLNEFPSLSKASKNESNRKSTSVTVPVSNAWVNLNSFNENKTKQEKSRGNPKSNKDANKNQEPPESNEHKQKNKKKKGNKKESIDDLTNGISKTVLTEGKEGNKLINGVVKKRSELNIGALEFSESSGGSEEAQEGASSSNKPPPGISVKPPPGFNNFYVTNDLTFTNSSGQSYSIIPSQQFYPPPNFKSRNQSLIEKFMKVLKDASTIQQFKVCSDMFRLGDIPAEKYYEHCVSFMGKEFNSIFPELLVLLPDVQKQQELYNVHKTSNGAEGLETCATCKQIVLNADLRNHYSNHILDNHFPVLQQNPVDNNNVWNRK